MKNILLIGIVLIVVPLTLCVAETPPPSQSDIDQLLRQFDDRSAAVREAAIRRLLPHPQEAGAHVVTAFRDGNLNVRLAALELLKEWKAPIDDLDPWQPETLIPERFATLTEWPSIAAPVALLELTEEQQAEINEEITRMLRISDDEAEAVRERLARWGTALLPLVYERIKTATTDQQRQRLMALRYRLVAGESLAERQPDVLLRLASPDTAVRRKSAEQLVDAAVAEDQMLLRELFSDSDPLVREISLRGIQKTGGQAQTMLLDLLADPEPNVRAAVLKQLEEKPDVGISAKIIEYVETETDADLVGHAVRVLRALRKQKVAAATRSLIELLKHDSWQVRADAAAALSSEHYSYSSRYSSRSDGVLNTEEQLQVDVSVALIKTLEDKDPFVVSKVVEGLGDVDMVVAVDPLLKVIERSPDLAAHVVPILNQGSKMRQKAWPSLRKMISHENQQVRAAIFTGIPNLEEKELAAGLTDTDSHVRIAAAKSLLQQFELQRKAAAVNQRGRAVGLEMATFQTGEQSPGILSRITNFFGFSGRTSPVVVPPELKVSEGDVAVILPDLPPGVTVTVEPAEIVTESSEKADEQPEEGDLLQDYFAAHSRSVTAEVYDQWLRDHYAGKNRLPWTTTLLAPLETMLSAESLEERAAAAATLVPFGRADEMVPLLFEASKERPELFETFAQAVPWLVYEKRAALFHQWRESTEHGGDQLHTFLERFFEVVDLRNEPILWDMLAEPETSEDMVSTVHRFLKPLYLEENFRSYNREKLPPPNIRAAMTEKLATWANSGNEYQRLLALVMLVSISRDQAAEIAQRLDADETLSDELRRDAFQIRLLTEENEKLRTEIAVDALKQQDPMRSKLAIRSLVNEGNALRVFRKRIYLAYDIVTNRPGTQRPVPSGLELDAVRPLLADANEEVAAYGGYFAALLGEAAGMEPLLKYWRKGKDDPNDDDKSITALVYRAIGALDDPQYVPTLQEIYATMAEHEVRGFYWAIRGMTGPEILKLRKEIRDKHGMENLQ